MKKKEGVMTYSVKNYDSLIGTPGFSNELLKNHFQLYKGYVEHTNALIREFTSALTEGKTGTQCYSELKRRFSWEFNGMRLHELYFDSMTNGGSSLDREAALKKHIVEDFGSFETWQKAFRAVGAIRGVGWTLLCYDPEGNSLYNVWVNEHDTGYLARTVPLLIMDLWEHAFMLDYGIKRDDYISAFLDAVDWERVSQRYEAAFQEAAGLR